MNGSSPISRLDLGRSMTWMFKSPNWITNLFWLMLCNLLGSVVIGTLVANGYMIEILQKRSRGRSDITPDFEPNRFVDYLTRGAWPFLVNLILYGVITMVFVVLIVITSLVCILPFQGQGQGQEELPPIAIAALVGGIGFWSVFFIASLIFVGPLCCRAGLANNFGEGFRFQWGIDFFRRMWPTLLFSLIFLVLCSFIAQFVGLLLCFVGLFFTASWFQLVMADLGAQNYDIYLSRGGEPVPCPEDVIDAQIL